MTTVIEDNELNTELQELYLKSKEWVSDLEFEAEGLMFLRKLINRNLSRLVEDDCFELIAETTISAVKIEQANADLKNRIVDYLHNFEHLVLQPDIKLELNLIETHNKLTTDLYTNQSKYELFKESVFDLTKPRLKESKR
ncbi:MAG TPA: hypothetical protein VGB63_03155 [Pedobacter sp.]|jgi:hypothetical protein